MTRTCSNRCFLKSLLCPRGISTVVLNSCVCWGTLDEGTTMWQPSHLYSYVVVPGTTYPTAGVKSWTMGSIGSSVPGTYKSGWRVYLPTIMYRFGARSSVIHDLSVLEKGNPPPHKKKDLQTEGPARNSVFLWNNTKNPIVRYLTHPVQHVYCLQRFEGRQDFWIGSVLFPGVVIISSC